MTQQLGVAKFGGTSMATMLDDVREKLPSFKYTVVSAPGKRDSGDTKLTEDLENSNPNIDRVMERFSHYGASPEIIRQVQKELTQRLERGNLEEIAAFAAIIVPIALLSTPCD